MDNIHDILTDVRKAYRLVYDFQKRVLDLMKFIKGKYRLNYEGGYSKFSGTAPRTGWGVLESWSWDWLNMYFYEFHFYPQENDVEKTHFSVFLLSDTGFYLAKKENEKVQKTTLSQFKDPEQSDTKLIFVAGKNVWHGWPEEWNSLDFTLAEQGNQIFKGNPIVFKQYDLALFASEHDALECLKDFSAYCAEFDITLNLYEKNID
jgi:hypothetical protein